MSSSEPIQEFFSIGEVCGLTELKPHVLRYWESQFRFLNPLALQLIVLFLIHQRRFFMQPRRQTLVDHFMHQRGFARP